MEILLAGFVFYVILTIKLNYAAVVPGRSSWTLKDDWLCNVIELGVVCVSPGQAVHLIGF